MQFSMIDRYTGRSTCEAVFYLDQECKIANEDLAKLELELEFATGVDITSRSTTCEDGRVVLIMAFDTVDNVKWTFMHDTIKQWLAARGEQC